MCVCYFVHTSLDYLKGYSCYISSALFGLHWSNRGETYIVIGLTLRAFIHPICKSGIT